MSYPSRLVALAPRLGMLSVLLIATTSTALPPSPSPPSLQANTHSESEPESEPEFVEWTNSREANRSEFRWSLDPSRSYESIRKNLVASLGIEQGILSPRYRTIEFFDHQGILARRGRLLRVRRTFSDDSLTHLRSADVTLKIRGENGASVRSQAESLWSRAGRKRSREGRVPWCLARGRSCKLEWDVAPFGAKSLAFSMKRSADDEKEARERMLRLAELAGSVQVKPLCRKPARELSWSAIVKRDGRPRSDFVVDFAWWHQSPDLTYAMELSVRTDDAGVIEFLSRKIEHLTTSRPNSKTARYLKGCLPYGG